MFFMYNGGVGFLRFFLSSLSVLGSWGYLWIWIWLVIASGGPHGEKLSLFLIVVVGYMQLRVKLSPLENL